MHLDDVFYMQLAQFSEKLMLALLLELELELELVQGLSDTHRRRLRNHIVKLWLIELLDIEQAPRLTGKQVVVVVVVIVVEKYHYDIVLVIEMLALLILHIELDNLLIAANMLMYFL